MAFDLCQSPSGRKLDECISSGEEEWIFQRVRCSDEPDFDMFHHLDMGTLGKWPNPYSFYWNYKRLEQSVDDLYRRQNKNQWNMKLMKDLEHNLMKIPYYRIGPYDTDASDSEDPHRPHVTDPDNPCSLRWRLNEVREPVMDPVARRYPYLYLYLQGKYYNKQYNLKRRYQRWKRLWYAKFQGFRDSQSMKSRCGKVHPGYFCKPFMWASHPLWYRVWRLCFRPIIRSLPRQWKFLKEKSTETIFFGTVASLYGTQYIAEHDVLPNMDDPVLTSEIALEKSLSYEIKEKFLTYDMRGRAYVDYVTMQRSKEYEMHLQWIGLMCRYQPIKMTDRVRKVFFLNFFNVLSIQTQIYRIPEVENMKYLWEMENFWETTKGLCGYVELNLEEIYHGILRCNRLHPIKQCHVFKEPTKGFPRELSPRRLRLEWLDPRIHFALSIGCKSCPPIQIFTLSTHDCQLEEQAKTYVRKNVKVDLDHRIVRLPILFLWYEKDFGGDQRVLLWYIKRFMLSKDMLKVRKLVTSSRPISFHYERFDDILDPFVRRHPDTHCHEVEYRTNRKHMPVYWGSTI